MFKHVQRTLQSDGNSAQGNNAFSSYRLRAPATSTSMGKGASNSLWSCLVANRTDWPLDTARLLEVLCMSSAIFIYIFIHFYLPWSTFIFSCLHLFFSVSAIFVYVRLFSSIPNHPHQFSFIFICLFSAGNLRVALIEPVPFFPPILFVPARCCCLRRFQAFEVILGDGLDLVWLVAFCRYKTWPRLQRWKSSLQRSSHQWRTGHRTEAS